MRKLIVAAVTAAALAAPAGASADTADSPGCVTPISVTDCVKRNVEEVVYQVRPYLECAIHGCLIPNVDPDDVHRVCYVVFGERCLPWPS